MKYADIQELCDREFISPEQRDRIVEAYRLRRHNNPFATIIAWFGGILVSVGLILLISANWEHIPRLVKVGGGLGIMLFLHAAALVTAQKRPESTKTSEALHFAGSLMFLANIALIGQVYHLSSSPGNAVAIWLLGIAALPWLLHSRAQWLLVLGGVSAWFGIEIGVPTGLFPVSNDLHQMIFYSLLGLIFFGIGSFLARSRFPEFGTDTMGFSLLLVHLPAAPLTWGIHPQTSSSDRPMFLVMGACGLALFGLALRRNRRLTWDWKILLETTAAVLVASFTLFFFDAGSAPFEGFRHWIMVAVLATACLIQIKAGVDTAHPLTVNLGVVMLGVYIFTAYILLIGSMAHTGLMFLGSGLFLLVLGFYLESKRRSLVASIQPNAPAL